MTNSANFTFDGTDATLVQGKKLILGNASSTHGELYYHANGFKVMSSNMLELESPKILMNQATANGNLELRLSADNRTEAGDSWAFKLVDGGTTEGSTFKLQSDFSANKAWNEDLPDDVLSITGTQASPPVYTSTFSGTVAATTFS